MSIETGSETEFDFQILDVIAAGVAGVMETGLLRKRGCEISSEFAFEFW